MEHWVIIEYFFLQAWIITWYTSKTVLKNIEKNCIPSVRLALNYKLAYYLFFFFIILFVSSMWVPYLFYLTFIFYL